MPNIEEAMAKINKRKSPKKRRPYISSIPKPRKESEEEVLLDEIAEQKVSNEKIIHPAIIEDIPKNETIQGQSYDNDIETFEIEHNTNHIISDNLQKTADQGHVKTLDLNISDQNLEIEKNRSTFKKDIVSSVEKRDVLVKKEIQISEEKFDCEMLVTLSDLGKSTLTVLSFLVNSASQSKVHVTLKIKKRDIKNATGIPFETIKTAIKRLRKCSVIKLLNSHAGIAGWGMYQINVNVYGEFNFSSSLNAKVDEESHELVNEEKIEIPKNFFDLGLSNGHLSQLKRIGIEYEVLQKSLDAFSYDLDNEDFKNRQRNPIAVFMKIMKSELEYNSCTGYVDPVELLLQEQAERKREALEKKKKLKEELLELSFEEWISDRSSEEIKKLVPNETFEYMGVIHKSQVKDYFTQKIFQG